VLEAVLTEVADWPALETLHREALETNRKTWTNDPGKWEGDLNGLVDVLRREGKYSEGERLFDEVLIPTFLSQPQSAGFLRDRSDFFARRGRWKEAAAQAAGALSLQSIDHVPYHMLAPLLVANGDIAGYRELCEKIRIQFKGADNPFVADRMAKDCLILPTSAADFEVIDKLADADFLQFGAIPSEESDGIPFFRFSDDAQPLFYRWSDALNVKLRQEDDEIVIEHLGKYRSLMPSLALIFHLCDIVDGGPSGPVSADATQKAVFWCEYLEQHARRIYGLVTNINQRAAARLAKRIKNRDLPDPFTVRDVYRKHWALLDDKEVVQGACDELVSLGWVREYRTENPIGRPRLAEYDINPRVWQ